MSISPGTREWRQVVNNGGFEDAINSTWANDTDDWIGWDNSPLSNEYNLTLAVTNAEARSGRHSLHCALSGSASQNFTLTNSARIRVTPGQLYRVSVFVKGASVAPLNAMLGIKLTFFNESGSNVNEYIDDLTLSGTFDWTEISFVGEVPAGRVAMGVAVGVSDTSSATGDLYFDDFKVWLERGTPLDGYQEENQDDHWDASVRGAALDIAYPYEFDTDDAIDQMLRFKQSFIVSTVLQLLLGARDHSTDFLLQLQKGGLTVDNLIDSLGGEKMGFGDDAELPRITTPFNIDASVKYTNLWAMPSPSGKSSIRFYVGDDTVLTTGSQTVFCIVTGASWDASVARWIGDISSNFCQMFMFSRQGLKIYTRDASAAAVWPDADWNDGVDSVEAIVLDANSDDGRIVLADGMLDMDPAPLAGNTNPLTSYAFTTNRLFAKTMMKSWGRIYTNSAVAPSVLGGVNIVSTAWLSNTMMRINFANPIATTGELGVLASVDSGGVGGYVLDVIGGSSNVDIEVFNNGGVPVDVKNSVVIEVYFLAMGEQVV